MLLDNKDIGLVDRIKNYTSSARCFGIRRERYGFRKIELVDGRSLKIREKKTEI
jgi:hypothetical protein